MKKIFLYILLVLAVSAKAQTSITSPTVSGIWNLAGSPYTITVPISIPDSQALTILPGVVVKFMSTTSLDVKQGQLIANGTLALPITFEANDTLGWSNQTTNAGGWLGISFGVYYALKMDSSIINNCIVKDMKSASIIIQRSLKILTSNFFHNGYASSCISITSQKVSDAIEVNSCNFHDNFSRFTSTIENYNGFGGYTNILNSKFSYNEGGAISSTYSNMKIENNEISHHKMIWGYDGAIRLQSGKALVKNNKIFKNRCGSKCAIGIDNCTSIIDGNFIFNNINVGDVCGFGGGGASIYLNGKPFGGYIVKNNVIANNFDSTGSDGTLFLFEADAIISNNHFINNSTNSYQNTSISSWGSVSTNLVIKNNLFYSKTPAGMVDSVATVWLINNVSILMENNYLPSKIYKSMKIFSGSILLGDTTKNIIGTMPQMITPTANNSYTTDATTANFNLLAGSPCINHGDSVGCHSSLVDYLGNNRISGGIIDIGAYEYKSTQNVGIKQLYKKDVSIFVYPNPASNKVIIISLENKLGEISIIDMLGKEQLLIHTNEMQTELNVSELKEGVYFVKVTQNGSAFTQKLVINK